MDEDKSHVLEALNVVTDQLKFVAKPPGVGEEGGEPIPLLIEVKQWAAKCGYTLDCAAFYEFYQNKGWHHIRHWRAILKYWNDREQILKCEVKSFQDYKDRHDGT
jgi:hypothetical protein